MSEAHAYGKPSNDEPIPVSDIEAEQQVIGSILVNNQVFDTVGDILQPDYFSNVALGAIYDWCREKIERGDVATPVTLRTLADEHLKSQGGVNFLVQLSAAVVAPRYAVNAAAVVLDAYRRRRLMALSKRLLQESGEAYIDHDADDIASSAVHEIDEIIGYGKPKGDLAHVSTGLDVAIERAEKAFREGPDTSGLSSGISDMDRAIGMLGDGRLYIGGGRPGMGKSAWAVRIARNVAKAGHPVAFFSLEMPNDEIATRLLAAETGISQERQELGEIADGEWDKIVDARADIKDWPLLIDDAAALTVHEIKRRALRMRRRHGLKLIIIDYLQLIGVDRSRAGRNNNRTNDLTEMTASLKALAKELSVPVIALSQLSRAVEQREDKRPTLSDLRESGSIEQDADVVLFPYREEYYLQKSEPVQRPDESSEKYYDRRDAWEQRCAETKNIMEIICAKRRGGRAGHARLYANMETGVITNGAQGGY